MVAVTDQMIFLGIAVVRADCATCTIRAVAEDESLDRDEPVGFVCTITAGTDVQ